MIRKHYFLVLINIRLLMLQAVHYREFAHVEQVAAVGLVFQIWKDPEPPQFAHGGLRKLVSQQQDLACSGSCSVFCSGDLDNVRVKTSARLLANAGFALHWENPRCRKLLDCFLMDYLFNGIQQNCRFC